LQSGSPLIFVKNLKVSVFKAFQPIIFTFFSFPLDKSYYMGLYFLYFHSHNIRKFVNILPAIFGR
jgi:hypothetical protein